LTIKGLNAVSYLDALRGVVYRIAAGRSLRSEVAVTAKPNLRYLKPAVS
jgi:hypothetical protein